MNKTTLWIVSALLALPLAARAQLLPTALVWIPAAGFAEWGKVDDVLRSRRDLKLTIALTPEMATPIVKDILGAWAGAGRVEFAARIPGDPMLSLVAAHPAAPRPDDALERSAEARQEVEKRLGGGPAGFVPGAGGIDGSLVGPLGASGATWVLTGPYGADGAPWAAAGKTVFVPAHAAPQSALMTEDLLQPGAWVFDESGKTESLFLSAITTVGWLTHPAKGWSTVAQLAAAAGPARVKASSVGLWSAWDGFPLSTPAPEARPAWQAYGEAAKALAQYQNSGTADLKVLEEATELLRKAQDARFYEPSAANAAADVPPELRARLIAFYKRLRVAAPEALYRSSRASDLTVAGRPTGLHVATGPDWAAFDNPVGTLAVAPAGAASAEPWRLRGLRVEWNDARVLLRLYLGHVDSPAPAPRPTYDVYMDLNHVIGAGSINLLEGRGAFAAARDAWEYALSIVGADARLWRATTSDQLEEVAKLPADVDAAHGEIRVAVPRAALRGNPARWGYLVLALAEDPARAGRAPAAILAGPDGRTVLGVLAPLDAQKALLGTPGPPQRVAAARVDAAP